VSHKPNPVLGRNTEICLDCAQVKKENERLQAEVIRLAQNWLDLKKLIISQEHGKASIVDKEGQIT